MFKINPKKNTTVAYQQSIYSIISITLVLLILGLLSTFLFQARALSTYFKERVEVVVVLTNEATQTEILDLEANLQKKTYTKKIEFIHKDKAASLFKQQFNEDFENILGYNPLYSSFSLFLNASHARADSIQALKNNLLKQKIVKDIFYQEALLQTINNNIQKFTFFLVIAAVIFLFIVFTLIDSTIKLAMYSNRFIIKTMQLVGATHSFIAQPFEKNAITNGLVSGVIASLLMILFALLARNILTDLALLQNIPVFLLTALFITLLGVFISWYSTRQAVLKYLKTQLDELY